MADPGRRVWVVRCEGRSADRANEPDPEDGGSDQELGSAGEQAQRLTTGESLRGQVAGGNRDRIRRPDRGGGETRRHVRSPASRTRGFSHEMRTSARSVANM